MKEGVQPVPSMLWGAVNVQSVLQVAEHEPRHQRHTRCGAQDQGKTKNVLESKSCEGQEGNGHEGLDHVGPLVAIGD